jgi:hypothetical protein
MERSEGVTDTLARVMKMLDRSNGNLLECLERLAGSNTRAVRNPRLQQLVADISGDLKPGSASAALAH